MARRQQGHVFGSTHTDDKLNLVAQYMSAYTTALKKQNFTLVYIDAFAGSGERTEVHAALPLFDGPNAKDVRITTPGSAKLALEADPPFDVLTLIEKDPGRYAELEELVTQHQGRKVKLHNGDANDAVQRICRGVDWHKSIGPSKGTRGLLFLDPYGMEVDWSTIEAVAATKAIDVWLFFPLSGLFRQAARSAPNIDAHKRKRLNAVLGTEEWFDRWYQPNNGGGTLFGDEPTMVRTADVDAIEAYVGERLSSIFKGKVLKPRRIYSGHTPLASLFFAISNPSPQAVAVATRIASHILNAGISSKVRPRK